MEFNIYLLFFILSIIIASISQIILKKGAKQNNIYINKYTIFGYFLMLLSTVFTLIGYKKVNLTLAAILQSLNFILVPFLSYIFLKEKISKKIVLGTTIIILGMIIYVV